MFRTAMAGAAVITLLFGSAADAQTPPRLDRAFVNVSFGTQGGGDDLSVNVAREVYGEQMTIDATHGVDGGATWDVAGGYRVWRNLFAGIAFSQFKSDGEATASVSIPHPLFTDAPRTGTASASGAGRWERALHFVASWRIPVTDKFDMGLSAGPSILFVEQDLISDVQFSEGSPFGTAVIGAPVVTRVKESGAGFHVGAEATYMLRAFMGINTGVGAFVRYSTANVSTDRVVGGEIKAGGAQFGVGARLRF